MSIEAMKLALEALESAEPKYTRQRADQKTLGGSLDYWKLSQDQRLQAITALRQAIEQAQKDYPFGIYGAEDLDKAWKSGYDNCKAQAPWTLEDVKKSWKSGYQAGLEQAQKPEHIQKLEELGWSSEAINKANTPQQKQEPVAFIDNRIHGFPDCFVNQSEPPHTSPVYTSPPQRQPLTDEEIDNAINALFDCEEKTWRVRMRAAIEAAHGIKGDT